MLVRVENEQVVTDSRKVAEVFGKEHKDVIEAVRRIIVTAENSAVTSMFYQSTYRAGTGKPYPMYLMNRDGFSLLVMGFTGKKAMEWKIKYIEAFNEMENSIKHISPAEEVSRGLLAAQKILEERDKHIKALEGTIEENKPKVVFADAVSASKQSILVGELAKLLKQNGVETGQKRLFQWLRDNGYLMRNGSSKNMPTQRSMERGLFEIKEGSYLNGDGVNVVTKTTKVTGKGQIYFINKLKEA